MKNKKIFFRSFVGVLFSIAMLFSLSACSNPLSFQVADDKHTETPMLETNAPPQETTPEALEPAESTTSIPESPEPAITQEEWRKDVGQPDAKYEFRPAQDDKLYYVTVTYWADEPLPSRMQIFDAEGKKLQTVNLGSIPTRDLIFEDVNFDEHIDIVVNTGGTVNETQDLYLWDPASRTVVKAIYEGFEMLAWYSVKDGYIENFIRGGTPDESNMEKLVWDGNVLEKVEW